MKKLFFKSFIAILFISLSSCSKKTEEDIANQCIDESLINTDAACYLIYAPVCGCDGTTYSNDCIATNNGVLQFEEGPCNSN